MNKIIAKFKECENGYASKFSASLVYAFFAAIAMNFFWVPGNIYSSGLTGLAQIVVTVFNRFLNLSIPFFIIAWINIGHRFTIFTGLTVIMNSIMLQIIPVTQVTKDPIICAIFGGAIFGSSIGFALKSGISSGGLDILTLTIRKLTGRSVGSTAIFFNAFIILMAALLYGWSHAFYSALGIFVSGKMMDVLFTRQRKMQVMIVTAHPDEVVDAIQNRMRRGITIIHDAEGAFQHDRRTVLFTVITRFEMPELEEAMHEADEHAFVSMAENVKIMGNFYEPQL